MHTIFTDYFLARARRFETEQPNPVKCLEMIQDTICILRGYEESISDLLAIQRAQARHDTLPRGFGACE